jgi:protein JSN1
MLLVLIGADGSCRSPGDQIHGTACITKIINSSFIDQADRDQMAERVRSTLLTLRVAAVPAYRKLVEDLGMQYQGAPSVAETPPYTPVPTFQPVQHSPQPQTPQQWPQQLGPRGYPLPLQQFDYSAYAMGYGAPQYGQGSPQYSQGSPQYSQGPGFSSQYSQAGPTYGGYYAQLPPPSFAPYGGFGIGASPGRSPGGGGAGGGLSPLPTPTPGVGSFSPLMTNAGLPPNFPPVSPSDHFASNASFYPFSPARSEAGSYYDGEFFPILHCVNSLLSSLVLPAQFPQQR